jgi:acetylornithine deacetylase/succinyl-diaminopimelate desuccinylase-like protein
MATLSLREEATDLLQRLIRLDTVNPPGNETAAAELLRHYLAGSGVQVELYAKVPDRANVVARISGHGSGPRLLLLCHTDTVLADAAEWQVDPWSGELRDGEIWGRGALDMKGQVAANAVALASLAREGFEPSGDLIFAATADEEVGDGFGLSWLCQAHPDAVRADYCINEGGGDRVDFGDGRLFYLCSVAEKMSSPFRLRVRGRSGHASMPGIADNALVKMVPLVERAAAFRPQPRIEPEVDAFMQLLVGREVGAEEALEVARRVHPLAAELIEPLLALTVSPTIISASQKRNVVPAVCELICDCRLLPGQTQSEAESLLRAALGPGAYELEWLEGQGGTRSPMESPLWDAMEEVIAADDPEARLAPICLAGFTDSHWLREAFGTVAYGFFPMRTMDPELAARLVHSADERCSVDDIELGVRFLRHAVRRLLDPSS